MREHKNLPSKANPKRAAKQNRIVQFVVISTLSSQKTKSVTALKNN